MCFGPPRSWSDGESDWYHCKPGKLLVKGQESRLGPWGSHSSFWHLCPCSWPVWGHEKILSKSQLHHLRVKGLHLDVTFLPLLVGCIFSAFFLNVKKTVCKCTQKVFYGSGNNCVFPHSPRWCHLFSSSGLAAVRSSK